MRRFAVDPTGPITSAEVNEWLVTPGENGRTLRQRVNWLASKNAYLLGGDDEELQGQLMEVMAVAATKFDASRMRPDEDRRRAFERLLSVAFDNHMKDLAGARGTARGQAKHRNIDKYENLAGEEQSEGQIDLVDMEMLAKQLPPAWRAAWRTFAGMLAAGYDTTEAYKAVEKMTGKSWPTFVRMLRSNPAFADWANKNARTHDN